jgi:hypothetical protein
MSLSEVDRFQATWNEGLIPSHGATLPCPQRGQAVGKQARQ